MIIIGLLALLFTVNDSYKDIKTTLDEDEKIQECLKKHDSSLTFASIKDLKECKPVDGPDKI